MTVYSCWALQRLLSYRCLLNCLLTTLRTTYYCTVYMGRRSLETAAGPPSEANNRGRRFLEFLRFWYVNMYFDWVFGHFRLCLRWAGFSAAASTTRGAASFVDAAITVWCPYGGRSIENGERLDSRREEREVIFRPAPNIFGLQMVDFN